MGLVGGTRRSCPTIVSNDDGSAISLHLLLLSWSLHFSFIDGTVVIVMNCHKPKKISVKHECYARVVSARLMSAEARQGMGDTASRHPSRHEATPATRERRREGGREAVGREAEGG